MRGGDVLILIPAAGAGSRMRGGDKLLEAVGGEPLLRRQARAALATGARVLVTLPPDRPARAAALAGLEADVMVVASAAEGMAASLRAGARAAKGGLPGHATPGSDERQAQGGAAALMVLPADMPEIDGADLAAVLAAHGAAPEAILRGAGADGTPGHPVLFPADLLPEFAALRGDEGARALLGRHAGRLRLVPLPGRHALIDLDTPEDWAEWRAGA